MFVLNIDFPCGGRAQTVLKCAPIADLYNLPLRIGSCGPGPRDRRVAKQQPLSWNDILNHLQ